jgi:hypothetical protein
LALIHKDYNLGWPGALYCVFRFKSKEQKIKLYAFEVQQGINDELELELILKVNMNCNQQIVN